MEKQRILRSTLAALVGLAGCAQDRPWVRYEGQFQMGNDKVQIYREHGKRTIVLSSGDERQFFKYCVDRRNPWKIDELYLMGKSGVWEKVEPSSNNVLWEEGEHYLQHINWELQDKVKK